MPLRSPSGASSGRPDSLPWWRAPTCEFPLTVPVLRWAPSAFLQTEKSFRKIQGYRDLRMHQVKLKDRVTGDDSSKVA